MCGLFSLLFSPHRRIVYALWCFVLVGFCFWFFLFKLYRLLHVYIREGNIEEVHLEHGTEGGEICDGHSSCGEFVPYYWTSLWERLYLLHRWLFSFFYLAFPCTYYGFPFPFLVPHLFIACAESVQFRANASEDLSKDLRAGINSYSSIDFSLPSLLCEVLCSFMMLIKK